jgi:glycine amidinotransferase/scyllo-inosamine-4-phosphate amidinotransferase 1
MKLNSHNEWDTLKEIIVGKPNARASLIFNKPPKEKVLEEAESLAREAYPEYIINEINEDLEGLCDVLKGFGAKVLRPNTSDIHKVFTTPYFTASAEHAYNARDLYLVVGDTIIESPSQEKHRYFEAQSYYDAIYPYFDEGSKWIAGPKPRLTGDYLFPFFEDERKYLALSEDEILFEAANTVRMGKDLLYLISRSGNYKGAKWLQSILGDQYRVHTTDKIYKSSHIDSTVLALGPKKVLLNSSRVNEQNCPPILNKCEKIWFDKVIPYPNEEVEFNRNVRVKVYGKLLKLGIESNLNGIASEWIGLNFLSLDTKTIVIDKRQIYLIETLQKHGFTCIPISFRHSYLMGGIHCSTLDTVRDSKLESYFD